jgi:hypothetical protein
MQNGKSTLRETELLAATEVAGLIRLSILRYQSVFQDTS